jgi:hypothetical protein
MRSNQPAADLLDALSKRRVSARNVSESDLPSSPGIYVWFIHSEPVFVGTTSNLRSRVFFDHLNREGGAINSALRRLAASELGFGTTTQLRNQSRTLSTAERSQVQSWIMQGEVSWQAGDDGSQVMSIVESMRESITRKDDR